MKPKTSLELKQNDELWQFDPFREPRAWALGWDVTELMKGSEAPAPVASASLFSPDPKIVFAREESDTCAAYPL
jgi:hypothetical protein